MALIASRLNRIKPSATMAVSGRAQELKAAGVGPGTIRLSVGIENVDDLIWDLEQGFARAQVLSESSELSS